MKLKAIWEEAERDVNCAPFRKIGYEPAEAFRIAAQYMIREIAIAADTFAGMAGVGGVETAGAIISYLAAHPEKIDLFASDGICALMDDAPDGPRGLHAHGCLTWHRKDGTVTTPRDLRIDLTVRAIVKTANDLAKS